MTNHVSISTWCSDGNDSLHYHRTYTLAAIFSWMMGQEEANMEDVDYTKATLWFAHLWDDLNLALHQFYYSEVGGTFNYL